MEKNEARVIRVCELWYSLVEDVDSVQVAVNDRVTVTLKTGKDWVSIPFTKGTGFVSERTTREAAGRTYDQELSVDVPGEDEEMVQWALENDLRPMVLKVVQNNGTKIYGDLVYPVRLKMTWSTETSSTLMSFARKAKERARWMEESESGSGS